jgi:alcohol dehydrogenase
MEDYWGVGKATEPMLPLIAVPTTAGTGSECQSFALISQEGTHVKMACGDPKAAAKVAILDPLLTFSQPPSVAATTGMDALSHAVESAVTKKRNAVSQMLSQEAFRLCVSGLDGGLDDPSDLGARGRALLGAALAGLAIENSMLGAAHAASNPLTGRYGITHGQAVGIMLPAVVRYNAAVDEVRTIYGQLATAAGLAFGLRNAEGGSEAVAGYVERYRQRAHLPRSLKDLNIRNPDVGQLAQDAARQWTAHYNPRPVGPDDFLRLYQSVASG